MINTCNRGQHGAFKCIFSTGAMIEDVFEKVIFQPIHFMLFLFIGMFSIAIARRGYWRCR